MAGLLQKWAEKAIRLQCALVPEFTDKHNPSSNDIEIESSSLKREEKRKRQFTDQRGVQVIPEEYPQYGHGVPPFGPKGKYCEPRVEPKGNTTTQSEDFEHRIS